MTKILVVGSGAREHALAHRLRCGAGATPLPERTVSVAPGNAGIALEHAVWPDVKTNDDLMALAAREAFDLVVVGPEQPLVEGLIDALAPQGVAVFGPVQEAARLEGEKSFMKAVLDEAGVPTARWGVFAEAEAAEQFHVEVLGGGPAVVKADGLCAGKGVVVATSGEEVRTAIRDMLGDGERPPRFGAASARIVVEELLPGRELSVIALCDGERAVPFAPARDHKRLLDGDKGPNTGGMGAVAPLSDDEGIDGALLARIDAEVFAPVLACLRGRGTPYRGFLYAGLMIDGDKVRVLEFNVRFGDPEAQAVMLGTEVDLLPLLQTVAQGKQLPADLDLIRRCRPTACVVLAAGGYPDAPEKGAAITGLNSSGDDPQQKLFCAGVGESGGNLVVAGGRVVSATACGEDLPSALQRAYGLAERVTFAGKQLRRDIGHSVLASGDVPRLDLR
ncbi:MAG: phosphoribosylamine--glycine ligase [Myxococcota bacterium]